MRDYIGILLSMQIPDVLDILIVTALIFVALQYFQKNNVSNLVKVIVAVFAILWLSDILRLHVLNFLLRKATEVGVIAVIILFQPEIRRAMDRIGGSWLGTRSKTASTEMEMGITQIVLACQEMSESKTGALLIMERDTDLSDIIRTGTVVNSDINAELIKNLFFNKAPLHDGAVIIRNGRVAAAGCVLPLTSQMNISKELGMRHRAGLGISEQSDALVVIVSEETGSISVAEDGLLKRHQTPANLEKILRMKLTNAEPQTQKKSFLDLLKSAIAGEKQK